MKKSLLLLLAISLAHFICAQQFTGKAIFSTSSSMQVSFGAPATNDSIAVEKKTTLPVSQQKDINQEIRKAMQKEYELFFTNKESLYKEIPKLKNAGEDKGLQVVGLGGGTEGGLYKNTSKNTYVENRDMFGKLFLIEDDLKKWDWKLDGETKKIGNYTCYKATAQEEVKSVRKVMKDGVEKEVENTSTKHITAWYTPEIPISHGPGEYWGLPGFILEVSDGRLNIFCSKIIVNPAEEIEIEVPTKGKKTDRACFKKLYNEKVQEMVKMYENKREKSKS